LETFERLVEVWHDHFSKWTKFIRKSEIKAFPTLTSSPSYLIGAQGLLMSGGLGALRPNTVLFGWPSSLSKNKQPFPQSLKILLDRWVH